MTTLAREFAQENLVSITKADYRGIRAALKSNRLLKFSQTAWTGGDKFGWIMKSEPRSDGRYLLIEHYEKKPEGGLGLVYKADLELYSAYKALQN